jgi:hypothetical protein
MNASQDGSIRAWLLQVSAAIDPAGFSVAGCATIPAMAAS